jgi:hypothetical protein
MKNNKVNFNLTIASIVACFCIFQQLNADRIVAFFFEPYPGDEAHAQNLTNKLQKPGHVAKCMINGYACYSRVAGIFSSYAGYLESSDVYGYTAFPRKQDVASFYILVTPSITPIFMFSNTVSHWQIEKQNPAAMYRVERKQDNQTKMLYWDVAPSDLPKDGIVPVQAIIIFADPKHIVLPTGITLTEESPNLLLPTIYVKKGIKATDHAIYLLNMNFLFAPVKAIHKKSPKKLDTLIY